MNSLRPYLIRAVYDWILANQMTPHVVVDASVEGVRVPSAFVEEGKIILNINPSAVQGFVMNDEFIEFSARFSGTPHRVFVPNKAVIVVYARETGLGLPIPDIGGEDEPPPELPPDPEPEKPARPALRVVK